MKLSSYMVGIHPTRHDNTSPLSLLNFFEEKYFVEKKEHRRRARGLPSRGFLYSPREKADRESLASLKKIILPGPLARGPRSRAAEPSLAANGESHLYSHSISIIFHADQ